jgi:hypothetical protein
MDALIIRKYDFLSRIPKGRVEGTGVVVQGAGVRVQGSEYRGRGTGITIRGPGSEQRQYLFQILIKKLPHSLLIFGPRCGKSSAVVRTGDYPELFRLTRIGK